jgi:hypothetical protein
MATLSGNKIKDTYQSLIKLTDNGNLTTGAKQLTDGFGNNSPLYISTTQIGIGVTPEATYDLHVYSNAKVGGNLTVTGDLTVEGTTTTIDTQTLTVEDPLIEVASNNTSTDAVDIGWYGKYAPSGTTLYAGLFRDTGDSKFKLFRNLEEEPTTTVNTSGTGYTVATLVADVEGTLTGIIASSTTATTQSLADNSTKVATTAYVDSSIGNSTLAEVLANGDTTGGGNIVFGDSDVFLTDDTLMFGASNDLVIYHDGSNSFIREKGTGNLYIDGETSISLRKYTGAENMLVANTDGSVELYYDNSKKLETTSTGVTVTGDLTVDTDTLFVDSTNNRVGILTTNPSDALNVDDDVSGSVRITIDNANAAGFSTLRFEENDTERAALYYSNAADTFNLQNNTNSGNLRLQTTNSIGTTTSGIIINGSSEAVELYYAGDKKLETTSTGVTITGTSIHTGIEIEDTNPQILFDETDVTANWRNRVSGGSWRVQYASDGSNFSNHFVVGASNATFETGATFAGQVTIPETPVSDTDAASKKYVDDKFEETDTLAEVLALGNTTGGTDIYVSAGDDITFTDTSKAYFGAENDLEIYHDGSVSDIWNYTGDLRIRNNSNDSNIDIAASNAAGTGSQIYIRANGSTGAAELYHYATKKFETTSTGVRVTGEVYIDGTGDWSLKSDVISGNLVLRDETNNADRVDFHPDGQVEILYAGVATTPSLIFNNDINTGIFHPSNDNLAFATAGSERMRIDNSGNVGINESDPDTILHISDGNTSDPSTNAPVIRLQNTSENCSNQFTDGDVVGGLEFYNDSIICTDIAYAAGVNAYVRAVHDGSDSPTPTSSLEFGTGSAVYASTRMTIDSSGNVGIGETSPSHLLHIKKPSSGDAALMLETVTGGDPTIIFNSAAANRNGLIKYQDNGTNIGRIEYVHNGDRLGFQAGSATGETMSIINGAVGIGTTLPSAKLDILQGSASPVALEINTENTFCDVLMNSFYSTNATRLRVGTNDFQIHTNGSQNLTVTSGGNVGIGTTDPDVKLHVDGGDLRVRDSGNVALQIISSSSGNSAIQFGDDGDANDGRIVYENTGDNMLFYTNDAEKMRIDSGGDVYIKGQANPTLYFQTNSTTTTNMFLIEAASYVGTAPYNSNRLIANNSSNIAFETGGSETMRIIDTGYVKARGRNTTAYEYPTNTFHSFEANESNEPTMVLFNDTTSNAYGLNVINGTDHNNTTSRFFLGQGGTTERIKIFSNGNVANTNNSYTALSDIKLKENIEDATPKLDELMQVRIRNYNLIGEELKQIGVVAQELEEVFPALVYETPDTERQDINKTDEDGNIIYQTEEVLISEAVEGQEAIEWEDKPTLDNTKIEIQTWLDDNEIEWQSADTKQELLDRIPEYQQEAVEAQDAVYETRETDIPVTENKEVDLGTTTKAVKYSVFVPIMIKAMQEQQDIINDLKAEIESLKQQINN